MTGSEHYEAAETIVARFHNGEIRDEDELTYIGLAHMHATMALVQATLVADGLSSWVPTDA